MQATLTPEMSQSTTGLLGAPAGELVLQICGGEHDGRVLRLTAAKCLIGSAAGCTLRLRARGVRPVHALILRGPAGALIRCWSPDAQLNDRGFTEALLEIGDKLQIGPVTLSVAELAQSPPQPRIPLVVPVIDQSAAPVVRPRPSQRQRRKQLFDHLRQERAQHNNLQARVEAQQSTIDLQRERLNSFETQVAQLQAAIEAAELNMAAVQAASEQRQSAAVAADDVLNQQLSKTIEQLQQELDAAAKRRTLEQQAHARQRAAWEEQAEQRHTAELEQVRQQTLTERDQLNTAAADLRNNFERQLALLEQQRIALTREVETLKTTVDAKVKSEEQARRTAAAQIDQLTQTFDLVRQERDELFERLHANQESIESQSVALRAQVEEARRSAQTQLEEVRRQAQAQIAEARAAAQKEIVRLREEFAARERQLDETLIAQSSGEMQRSAGDAERILRLTAEVEAMRAEARLVAASVQQQQDGFTQARKRLEAEIAELNVKVQASGEALHEARENSGMLQAAVLVEAEQARAQRDAVREQMLRQQQDWTEFRSRLELAATAEREMAQSRYDALQAELATREQTQARAEAECEALQQRLNKLEIELEQAQESLFAAEHGANQRLQQMTVSMEQLHREQGNAQVSLEEASAAWEQERNALAQCVADLQLEVSQLNEKLQTVEQQAQKSTADSHSQIETAELQLQAAREQVAQWQVAAEQAREQAEEFSQTLAHFQQQEQAWQLEREQLDQLQQSSTDRLQQLEASISELQQQLDEARCAVAVTCPPSSAMQTIVPNSGAADIGCTVNVNNQDLAALREQMQDLPADAGDFGSDFGSTINVNNQELAALREQGQEPIPSLLAPREIFSVDQREAFQAREEALQAQADELAEQQSQLEEEQAFVARQRIELEQFQASLLELEHSLTQRAQALLQQASPAEPDNSLPTPDYHDSSYGEPERESNPLSESEAFAAMADHVASLHSADAPAPIIQTPAEHEFSYEAPAVVEAPFDSEAAEVGEFPISEPAAELPQEEIPSESLIINSPLADEVMSSEHPASLEATREEDPRQEEAFSGIAPQEGAEEFDNDLDERIARVMRREKTDWPVTPQVEHAADEVNSAADEAPEQVASSPEQAVDSVLERLREAGLWKGEGTAKADQLPSSNPPLDDSGAAFCRPSQDGPIGYEESVEDAADKPIVSAELENEINLEEEAEVDLSPLARPTPPATLLNPTANQDHEADDSIESYMSRLMQRLRTTDDEEPSPRKTSGSSKPAAPAAKPVAAPPPKLTDSRPLTSLEELAPRSQAPELSSNLAAMRELANSAARGAIETHQHRHKRQRVNMRTIHTLLASVAGGGLILWWYRTGSWVALGSAGLSVLWALGSLVAAMQSLILRRPNSSADEQPPADQPAE